jgi:outer membrane protein assembly factor BamE (lipoprotein component of BamABCDE complex)
MRTMAIPGRLAPVRMAVAAMAAMAALAAMVAVALTGCVVIPVDYYDSNSRRNITPDTASSLVPGVTTREEVIMRLGEPNHVADDGRRIGYAWEKVKAIVAAGYGGSGGAGEIERGYLLEITFDHRNKVREVNFRKKWGGSVLKQEAAEDAAKMRQEAAKMPRPPVPVEPKVKGPKTLQVKVAMHQAHPHLARCESDCSSRRGKLRGHGGRS